MAILTRSGMTKILRRIMESGGMTDDMEDDVRRLQDDFDEREGILRKYGETYDGEDRDEYEFSEREEDKLADEWRIKYEEMKKRYLDRFFGTDEIEDDYFETMRKTREDVKRDGEPQSFDELLERVEG